MESALAGVRVLDLTQHLAGPYGSLILADLGAEVIKIEDPRTQREVNPAYSYKGQDSYYMGINRCKKSMYLNLKTELGKEVFYDLVKVSDVVFDNYRPGVPARLGIDYDTIKKINPRVISCSISGYGATGPYRDRPAYDLIIQAMSGGMSITGEEGRPPVRSGVAIGDQGAGVFAAMGILSALFARERTGVGQKVETSLLEAHMSLLAYEASFWLVNGVLMKPVGSSHETAAPYRAFKTKDDYIVIAAQDRFEKFCRVIGREDLSQDPRFCTRTAVSDNKKELYAILDEIFPAKTADEWLDILVKGDIPCSRVNTLDRALADPQVLARDMVVSIDHTLGGKIKLVGNAIKLSATPPEQRKRFISAPLFGEHSDEVLRNILGYPEERIEELKKQNIICPPNT